jgi:type II secretory pathway component GspD/PulD (secretin)
MKLLTASCVLPFLAALLPAQQEARPAEKPAATKAPFVFEAGVVELRAVITRCGAYLQRNVLVDDSELMAAGNPARGKRATADGGGGNGPFVELQLPVVTDAAGCEELLTGLLWSRGLALVPLDEAKGVYEVLAMSGARGREVTMRAVQRTPEQVLARPALRQFVTVVVALQHTNATIATNALRPFFASTGQANQATLQLGNVGNSTAIVITGPQDQCANAIQLLRTADVPQPPELAMPTDAIAQQLAKLAQRLATLEEKVGKTK